METQNILAQLAVLHAEIKHLDINIEKNRAEAEKRLAHKVNNLNHRIDDIVAYIKEVEGQNHKLEEEMLKDIRELKTKFIKMGAVATTGMAIFAAIGWFISKLLAYTNLTNH